MGWEQRGNRTYYYTAERICRKVVKHYCPSSVAEHAAALVVMAREKRDAAVEALRAERERLDALTVTLDLLNELANTVAAATLLAAGYHRNGLPSISPSLRPRKSNGVPGKYFLRD